MKTIALRIKNEQIINWIGDLEGREGYSANAVVNALLVYAHDKAQQEESELGFALIARPTDN